MIPGESFYDFAAEPLDMTWFDHYRNPKKVSVYYKFTENTYRKFYLKANIRPGRYLHLNKLRIKTFSKMMHIKNNDPIYMSMYSEQYQNDSDE